jgi:hypothetical protein
MPKRTPAIVNHTIEKRGEESRHRAEYPFLLIQRSRHRRPEIAPTGTKTVTKVMKTRQLLAFRCVQSPSGVCYNQLYYVLGEARNNGR